MSIKIIRSVVKGILGVPVLQSLAGGVGMSLAGVPAAGRWAGVILVLAVVQLPPALILLPACFWGFSELSPVWATIFLIWNLVVLLSEQVLKPILFGRGVEAPMLVVFVGAIGGMLTAGIIGLFVGPVILSLFWILLQEWIQQGLAAAPDDSAPVLASATPVAPAAPNAGDAAGA